MADQLALPMSRLRRPAAQRDPETSHAAARQLARSGVLGAQALETLRALAAWPSIAPTSAELAAGNVTLRFRYARRLADLRELGYVTEGPSRVCRVTGRHALTWRITPFGQRALV